MCIEELTERDESLLNIYTHGFIYMRREEGNHKKNFDIDLIYTKYYIRVFFFIKAEYILNFNREQDARRVCMHHVMYILIKVHKVLIYILRGHPQKKSVKRRYVFFGV